MDQSTRKASGAYYTPREVAHALVRWAVRLGSDRMLDPACGDGRFLSLHQCSTGVEQDAGAAAAARLKAPEAVIHDGDFFAWAEGTADRFECAAGNPPFVRYQRFSGSTRKRALDLCAARGAKFSGLSSAWAPFLVAAASLLRPGGRMAFVVPAEIGHAPYSAPLLGYLLGHFEVVQLIAVREKIFPALSEDCWLLFAEGFGGATSEIRLSQLDRFVYRPAPPDEHAAVPLCELRRWDFRLRPFLLPSEVRSLYEAQGLRAGTTRLGDVATVGIGYVTGDNDFFHLRPSEASERGIPPDFLHPSVRSGRMLPAGSVTARTLRDWVSRDEPVLLLRLAAGEQVPPSVQAYLDSPVGRQAQTAYKCRTRDPWYAVPDVRVPDAFLSYMSGKTPALVANEAGCTCTNSLHAVSLSKGMSVHELRRRWDTAVTRLSCELEGHPLGGGMLKLEPREAARIIIPDRPLTPEEESMVDRGTALMRYWRHHG